MILLTFMAVSRRLSAALSMRRAPARAYTVPPHPQRQPMPTSRTVYRTPSTALLTTCAPAISFLAALSSHGSLTLAQPPTIQSQRGAMEPQRRSQT